MSQLSRKDKEEATKIEFPKNLDPMLATLQKHPFDDSGWIFERKFDGVRIVATIHNGNVRLATRNGKDKTNVYPEVTEKLSEVNLSNIVLDGEIVTFEGNVTSFSKLQDRMKNQKPDDKLIQKVPVKYYVFDLPYLEGYDLSQLTLRRRKSLLRSILRPNKTLKFTSHINENGMNFFKQACRKGWEGVIAKNADSHYQGSRSTQWLKLKCTASQELVIGGITHPSGERIGFGAILVGYYENDRLLYAGKVGTGFTDEQLQELKKSFDRKKVKNSPFSETVDEEDAIWIKPEFVAEIAFTEWTSDQKLRHPRFLGLREDKNPKKVTKEQ